MNKAKVIAISGASGAGKTTVVKLLAKKLNCDFLLFDDYTNKDSYPDDMKKWLTAGANVSVIETPNFVSALQRLILNSTNDYIFIEEPFGKERAAIAPFIDYVVLLHQPLDLCLMRIIKRHTEHEHSSSLNSISCFLDKYEDHLRDSYIVTVNQVRNNSDLIVNEVLSAKATTNMISEWLIDTKIKQND
jgi:uridine kinase